MSIELNNSNESTRKPVRESLGVYPTVQVSTAAQRKLESTYSAFNGSSSGETTVIQADNPNVLWLLIGTDVTNDSHWIAFPTTDDGDFEYLAGASGVLADATIATVADLSTVATVDLPVNTLHAVEQSDILRFYQLKFGSSSTSLPDIVRPDDWDFSTNQKIWEITEFNAPTIDVDTLYLNTLLECSGNANFYSTNTFNGAANFESTATCNDMLNIAGDATIDSQMNFVTNASFLFSADAEESLKSAGNLADRFATVDTISGNYNATDDDCNKVINCIGNLTIDLMTSLTQGASFLVMPSGGDITVTPNSASDTLNGVSGASGVINSGYSPARVLCLESGAYAIFSGIA